MKKFEFAIKELIATMEDIAGDLLDNAEVKAYFEEYYGFDSEIDDPLYMLIQYIDNSCRR